MATPEGTKKYADRFGGSVISEDGFRIFGKTGFTVSKLGFGGYRIHHDSKVNRRSLQEALLNGVNLIDTSSNYSDGGSESLIGRVIHKLMGEHKIDRDELVIVSKAGYVQGRNLSDAKKREQSGRPFPEMVKYMEGCWHCIRIAAFLFFPFAEPGSSRTGSSAAPELIPQGILVRIEMISCGRSQIFHSSGGSARFPGVQQMFMGVDDAYANTIWLY